MHSLQVVLQREFFSSLISQQTFANIMHLFSKKTCLKTGYQTLQMDMWSPETLGQHHWVILDAWFKTPKTCFPILQSICHHKPLKNAKHIFLWLAGQLHMLLVHLKLRIWREYSESYMLGNHSCKVRFKRLSYCQKISLVQKVCISRSILHCPAYKFIHFSHAVLYSTQNIFPFLLNFILTRLCWYRFMNYL